MSARSLLTLSALLASSALAAPAIDPQFGDHAVIQRGKPFLLSGTAAPNERLTVDFGEMRKNVRTDAHGRWQAEFAPRAAGGPLTIRISGADGAAVSEE